MLGHQRRVGEASKRCGLGGDALHARLLLLALEGLDLAPARHPRGVDGVQGAVAERREVVRQAALLDLLVYCILEVRERLLPKACVGRA